MPVCFQLFDKKKPSEGPVVLQKVDEEMCAHFEVPCDEKRWLGEWYQSIGFRLAIGKTFEQIREEFDNYVEEDKRKNDEGGVQFFEYALKILTYLEEHYVTSSFYSPFK